MIMIVPGHEHKLSDIERAVYVFSTHVVVNADFETIPVFDDLVPVRIGLHALSVKLNMAQILAACRVHGIKSFSRASHIDNVRMALKNHHCSACPKVMMFLKATRNTSKPQVARGAAKGAARVVKGRPIRGLANDVSQHVTSEEPVAFPPRPTSDYTKRRVVTDWCDAHAAKNFVEVGCGVCGQLVKKADTVQLTAEMREYDCLRSSARGTRKERNHVSDPISPIEGPVIDEGCDHVCNSCCKILKAGKVPLMALANNMWLGTIPDALQGLYFAERMLIAKVRHNRIVMRVSSGMHKMIANAIAFANPTLQVYDMLPPPRGEIEDVISFIFVGPCKPTSKDLERTPMIVRRAKVAAALEWLKLNHDDYAELTISYDNLDQYTDFGSPVAVAYRKTSDPSEAAAQPADHDNEEVGTSEGRCSLVVHGLVGGDFGNKSWDQMVATAVEHLAGGGGSMAVSHMETPQSMYHNPALYPQMFPWLFPYGKGGLDQEEHFNLIAAGSHKRWMLMYWDKCFQVDPEFPIVAHNHEQIKASVKGGFLMVKKKDVSHISERLLNIDLSVLKDMSRRLSKGERIKNKTHEQVKCFRIINDLDLVGAHVQGSRTCKKYMRNEIWSMIEYEGAPSWFITFAPADVKSPICLYYADQSLEFKPEILDHDARFQLIAKNPVAGARFFKFIVETFIRCVLGVGEGRDGLFGRTSSYYGTVEQQGRLTLHLHLLLWIRGSLTPQEIRDRIMEPDGEFQGLMVNYLESAHQGEFKGGPGEEVRRHVAANEARPGYVDPTLTTAARPPAECSKEGCDGCEQCVSNKWWNEQVDETTNDILLKSNMHDCGKRCYKDGRATCKSRFPRDTYDKTMVDPNSGALNMKKGEPNMNTFNYTMTYLFRCNTDVTSLLSGTALKAVVAYVTEYVTKVGLKTYGVFDVIHSVFDRNTEMLGGTLDQHEKTRKIMTQVVNSLTSKSEIGGPMAAMYLLGHDDHYTNREFRPCYWRSYVAEARKVWDGAQTDADNGVEGGEEDVNSDEKVILGKHEGRYVGLSRVDDYTLRPKEYSNVNLYTWIRLAVKESMSKSAQRKLVEEDGGSDTDSDDNYLSDGRGELSDEEEPIAKGVRDKPKQFLKGHGQRKTHWVSMMEDDGVAMPNFIGGNLPRSDKGDREAYCATMLALFKPWRSGYDLKASDTSWDDAFEAHSFEDIAVEKMKYFNVKYECTDARDDFSAQRRGLGGERMGHMNSDDGGDDGIGEEGNYISGINEDLVGLFATESPDSIKHRQKLQREIAEIKTIMLTSGWLDESVDGLPELPESDGGPSVRLVPGKWQTAVQAKKHEVLANRGKNMSKATRRRRRNVGRNMTPGTVEVVGKDFLSYKYKATLQSHQDLTDRLVVESKLNEAQTRAFRIVANHANDPNADRLQMYLGGMGGTGKSTVIKALVQFFQSRNEAHRFIIVAPTGAAAALLHGSTYHSVFGINDRNDDNEKQQFKQVGQIRSQLEGVEYVFLDEVSMLGCRSMYMISAAAAKALGVPEEGFGGLNMIFAGDFAQLAPVKAQALYSSNVGTRVGASMSLRQQEESIGKALWHQTTTVVILRENMRQRNQSKEDNRLRTALENMRYKACTDDDVAYLRSRISGRSKDKPRLAQKRFRNVSVITARNLQKDQINDMGARRFAAENKRTLTVFYAKDAFKSHKHDLATKEGRVGTRGAEDTKRSSDRIPLEQQEELWNLNPSHTKHIPGKLSLCVGMPVMVRYNEATECCITKGAEA
ncbi:hypothetical protein HWV62_6777 [Athelia sp. TMB]|nr:hypothetical protein HWV62_6777 [Athelia sp. TMB]